MSLQSLWQRLAVAVVVVVAGIASAWAHHGWACTEDETFTLTGVIEDIYLGNPHARLDVRADDGVWQVDLAPLGPTARAGFVEGVANVGDEVTAIGNRSRDPNERRMKAARIIVNGNTYDVYPRRVGS